MADSGSTEIGRLIELARAALAAWRAVGWQVVGWQVVGRRGRFEGILVPR